MKHKICAVVQATYPSDIFPGKSMVKIAGKTVLEHIVSRIGRISYVSETVLATSDIPENGPLVREAIRLGIRVFKGDEADVVSRLCGAAKQFRGETILKVNGNYPLFDPFLAEELIKSHIKGGFDFSYNEHLDGTVYGTGCEILGKKLLQELDNNKKLTPEQRDAGTLYFHQNVIDYKINRFKHGEPRPHYKVCFETEKDLKLIEFIFKNLKSPYASEIVSLLDKNPVLAESNKHDSVQEVGIEKLYLFPEKLSALNPAELDTAYPISVELSLTNRCNFNCVWCSDKDLRARMSGDMDLKTLKKLFKDLKSGGTRGIVIEGGGEPTLHKHFADAVNFAAGLGLGVGLITNGSVAIKPEIADRLEWIRISLDASNAEEQKLLKKSDRFEKVMSNIKTFCKSKATVGVGYVVTSQNIGSLESLLLRLSEFGISYIQFRPVIDHPELDVDIDLSYLKRYENSRFSIITDGMKQNLVEGNAGLPCTAHGLTTVIAADGSVYLCGRLNIYDWLKPIGNINKESFRAIWLGEERARQAAMVLDPPFCKKYCPRCRLTKFNQLFHRLNRVKTKNFI